MKIFKLSFVLVAAAAVIFGLSGISFAFHSGGVAECMGCHNIHDAASSSALLNGSDISSTCLECHAETPVGSSYHIFNKAYVAGSGTVNKTPGGDFAWLTRTYSYSPRSGTTTVEDGFTHGHNIIAADFGLVSDGVNTMAPGGDMDATQLTCNSCHDNHGKLRRTGTDAAPVFGITGAPIIASGSYNTSPAPAAGQAVGAYRLLRGTGSTAGSGGKTFSAIFNAVVPGTYNRSEITAQTRVAYGAGITDWCATCHPDMHSATSTKMTHPVNQALGTTVTANYNAYIGSGNMSGTAATSYDSIVPFQTDNTNNYTSLKALADNTGAVTAGPATSDRVMCLSCHRAHASGFMHMERWQNEGEFITADGVWPGSDSPSSIASAAKYAMGRSVAETQASYNGQTMKYATYQRSLCNKCHAKD